MGEPADAVISAWVAHLSSRRMLHLAQGTCFARVLHVLCTCFARARAIAPHGSAEVPRLGVARTWPLVMSSRAETSFGHPCASCRACSLDRSHGLKPGFVGPLWQRG